LLSRPIAMPSGLNLHHTCVHRFSIRQVCQRTDMKSSPDDVQDLYRDFIDGVIEAARTAHFLPPIGRGEGRLRGFHGG
jgi:hypothetical protein